MRRDEFNDVVTEIMKHVDASDEALEKIKEYGDNYSFDEVDWREKFNEMKERYTTRFFTSEEQIESDQWEDIENDTKAYKSIDEMFVEREGDYNA